MRTLVIQLVGPLQSWGGSSRFNRRSTDDAPTKSGVVGLLAAAAGRRRTDPIQDLARIRLAVRIDQPGQVLRDYHTASVRTGRDTYTTQVSNRFYLSDAIFLATIEGDDGLISAMVESLRRPVFALALGRRSCVPSRPLLVDVTDDSAETVLAGTDWLATDRVARRSPATVELETVIECDPSTPRAQARRDDPISFDPALRVHGWRSVLRGRVTVVNTRSSTMRSPRDHEPMDSLADL